MNLSGADTTPFLTPHIPSNPFLLFFQATLGSRLQMISTGPSFLSCHAILASIIDLSQVNHLTCASVRQLFGYDSGVEHAQTQAAKLGGDVSIDKAKFPSLLNNIYKKSNSLNRSPQSLARGPFVDE